MTPLNEWANEWATAIVLLDTLNLNSMVSRSDFQSVGLLSLGVPGTDPLCEKQVLDDTGALFPCCYSVLCTIDITQTVGKNHDDKQILEIVVELA